MTSEPRPSTSLENLSPAALRTIEMAQEEACAQGHEVLGPLHLLAALTRDEGVAGRSLAALNVTTAALQDQAATIFGRTEAVPSGDIPLTPNSLRALDRARRLQLKLHHPHVGPEHILMAMTTFDEVFLAWLRGSFGITAAQIREAVARQTWQLDDSPTW